MRQLLERVGLHDGKQREASGGHRLQPRQERRLPRAPRKQRLSPSYPASFVRGAAVSSLGISPPSARGGAAALEELDELGWEGLEVYAEALIMLQLVVVILANLQFESRQGLLQCHVSIILRATTSGTVGRDSRR